MRDMKMNARNSNSTTMLLILKTYKYLHLLETMIYEMRKCVMVREKCDVERERELADY